MVFSWWNIIIINRKPQALFPTRCNYSFSLRFKVEFEKQLFDATFSWNTMNISEMVTPRKTEAKSSI